MNPLLRDELVEILREELPDCSLVGVFAAAMELSAQDRVTLFNWLEVCDRAGLQLTPESIRRTGRDDMIALLGQ